MAVENTLYNYKTLLKAADRIKYPNPWLYDFLVQGMEDPIITNIVDMPVYEGRPEFIPFVGSGMPGQIVDAPTEALEQVKIPRIVMLRHMKESDLQNARSLASQYTYVNQKGQKVDPVWAQYTKILEWFKGRLAANKAVSLASILVTGELDVQNAETGHLVEIDYRVPSAQKTILTGNDRWGETSGDIVKNIQDMRDAVLEYVEQPQELCLFVGSLAKQKMLADEAFMAGFNNTRVNPGNIVLDGGRWFGTYDGINLYRYSQRVSIGGTLTEVFPTHQAVMVARYKGLFDIAYGIPERKKVRETGPVKEWYDAWDVEEPDGTWMVCESRPVFRLYNPGAIFSSSVCDPTAT